MVTLNGKDYIVEFEEHATSMPDGESMTFGDLEIFFNDKKVLGIDASQAEYDKYGCGGEWSLSSVTAFIEGDWIKDFKELEKSSRVNDKKNEEEYEQKRVIDEAERLKKDFGIE